MAIRPPYPQPYYQGMGATLHCRRERRSCVDEVAVMLNRARTAWGERKITGALLIDAKSAFNNVAWATSYAVWNQWASNQTCAAG